MTSGGSNVK